MPILPAATVLLLAIVAFAHDDEAEVPQITMLRICNVLVLLAGSAGDVMYNRIDLVVPAGTVIDSPVMDTLSGVTDVPEDTVPIIPVDVVPSYTLKKSDPELLLIQEENDIVFTTRLFPAEAVT